ncbi:MAG: hypothetical protein HRT58_07080 [Crocinitomicaceae bacterium]|nr:hypothetical protein [Flavobacteriales bacterium]NQZ35411.1 hypothetical protein [Crocinitomicaceae bacterium]
MKSKRTPITLIITVLVIVIGYLAYTNYIVPFYLNNSEQTKKIDLKIDHNLILVANKNQKNIKSLEFEIIGNSTQNISILTYESSKYNIQRVTIKKGEIDHVNFLNWTSDSCFMDISTPENCKGSLTINYRFIGSN